MGQRNRLIAAAVTVLAATALTSAALGASPRLTDARFQALDAVYRTAIPLEKNKVSADEIAAADQACQALDPADALLAKMRPACLLGVEVVRYTEQFTGCDDQASCKEAIKTLRVDLQNLVSAMHTANRGVKSEVAAGACRKALMSSKDDFADAALLINAFRKVEHALDTGRKADLDAADRALNKADKAASDGPSAKTQRKRFRTGCK